MADAGGRFRSGSGGVRHTNIIGAHLSKPMADDRRKNTPDNPGLKVLPNRRQSDRIDHFYPPGVKPPQEKQAPPQAEAVAVIDENGDAVLLHLDAASNMPQKIIALAAAAAIFYFGKPVLVPIVCSLLLGFLLDPPLRMLERIKVPRAAAAFLVMLALTAGMWALSYFSYVRVAGFVRDLPKY